MRFEVWEDAVGNLYLKALDHKTNTGSQKFVGYAEFTMYDANGVEIAKEGQ